MITDRIEKTPTRSLGEEFPTSTGSVGAGSNVDRLTSTVNGYVSRGVDALKGQYRTVSEKGVQGVRDDVVGYAKREPAKALLLAGGIGFLASLLLRRR